MQEGVVGLLWAVKRYDPGMGTPFWAYATWWVRQAMQQLVSEMTRPVVLSDRAQRRLAHIKGARREHVQAHGREPSPAELASLLGLPLEQIDSLLVTERIPRGLDEPVRGEDDATAVLGDFVADPVADDEYERVFERMEIEEMRDLSGGERERRIVYAHYGLGCAAQTLREIAGGLGLSVERVRQLEERALGKLREAAASAGS